MKKLILIIDIIAIVIFASSCSKDARNEYNNCKINSHFVLSKKSICQQILNKISSKNGNTGDVNIENLLNKLVAYYPFNGNANDISGNMNHGIVNRAKLVPDRFEKSNSAYYFDGSSSIYIPNSQSLSIAKQFSFTVWFNADNYNDGQVVFAKSGDRNGIELKVLNPNIDLNNGYCCPITGILSPGNYTPKKWHFVAITFDGEIIKTYLDGKFSKSLSDAEFNLNYNMANEPLRIGIGLGGKYYAFKGYIDDFCVFNRPLSTFEINMIYNLDF